MKRNLLPITLILAGVMMLTSCLSDDDSSSDIVYYGDGAITAFSLGTLNQYYLYNNGDTIKKTTDGTDSTTTVDCSSVKMTIDQLAYARDKEGNLTKCHPIFNTDSLPAGTDISRVLTSVSSKNSGVVTLLRLKKNSTDKDTLDYYSSSDSIDFTTPREFRVFSTDGTYYRRYLVTLNVHKEQPDSFAWHRQQFSDVLAGRTITAARTYAMGDMVYTALTDGTATYLLGKNATSDNAAWDVKESNLNMFSADAYKNIAVLNGWMYLLSRGTLFRSQDAANWQQVQTGLDNLKQLVGAAGSKLYALTEGCIMSSADGTQWTAEALGSDETAANLPQENVSLLAMPLKSNSNISRLILMGSASGSTGTTTVWGKIEDPDDSSYKWTQYNGEADGMLPDMAGLQVMKYDGKLYAIGGAGQNGSTVEAYGKLYCSSDQGLTWQKGTLFSLPADMDKSVAPATLTMAADAHNHVWITSASTRSAWKMRINRLGWKKK